MKYIDYINIEKIKVKRNLISNEINDYMNELTIVNNNEEELETLMIKKAKHIIPLLVIADEYEESESYMKSETEHIFKSAKLKTQQVIEWDTINKFDCEINNITKERYTIYKSFLKQRKNENIILKLKENNMYEK